MNFLIPGFIHCWYILSVPNTFSPLQTNSPGQAGI